MMLMCIVAQYLIIKLEQVFFAPSFVQPNAHLTLQLGATSWGLESYIGVNNAFLLVNIYFRAPQVFIWKCIYLSPSSAFQKQVVHFASLKLPKIT